MFKIIFISCIVLPLIACEPSKNNLLQNIVSNNAQHMVVAGDNILKRSLEDPELPPAKKIHLSSRMAVDPITAQKKLVITIHHYAVRSNNLSCLTQKNSLRAQTRELLDDIYQKKIFNKKVEAAIRKIFFTETPCTNKVYQHLNDIFVNTIFERSLDIIQSTLWHVIEKTTDIPNNEYNENKLLSFLFYYEKYIDLFSQRNSENNTLLEFAVKKNNCLATKALLQFNSDLKSISSDFVTTISSETILKLKEIASDDIKGLLSISYEPRKDIRGTLHKYTNFKISKFYTP